MPGISRPWAGTLGPQLRFCFDENAGSENPHGPSPHCSMPCWCNVPKWMSPDADGASLSEGNWRRDGCQANESISGICTNEPWLIPPIEVYAGNSEMPNARREANSAHDDYANALDAILKDDLTTKIDASFE